MIFFPRRPLSIAFISAKFTTYTFTMPVTEKDIQLYIWGLKDKWKDLIKPATFPEPQTFIEDDFAIYSLTPEAIMLNQVTERLKEMDGYVRDASLMGCEVYLKKDEDSTIRADLLCASAGRAGFGVIEIKKSEQTERQAYTELLGYGNHIQGLFPGMSTEDLTYVLISPMKERIVREATLLSLLLDEKPVYCLIPEWENDDVTTLKLIPWIPEQKDLTNISGAVFHPSNIEVFKLTWSAVPEWNCDEGEDNPDAQMIQTMNKIAIYAAQLMESKHIAGFAFTAQTWKEIEFLDPNSLVIAAINPYRVSKARYLLEQGEDIHKIEDTDVDSIKMEHILPEIINRNNPQPEHAFMEWMITGWGNTITGIAMDALKTMLINSVGATHPTNHGGMTWKQYEDRPLEDTHQHIYEVYPTGLFRKLFMGYQEVDYQYMEKFGYENHPHFSNGDVPDYAIDNWYKQFFFRSFLNRLFDPFREFREMIEFDEENDQMKRDDDGNANTN